MTTESIQSIKTDQGVAEVSIIMTKGLTTVAPDRLVPEVLELFEQVSFHHLPVTQDGFLVGILSDRDISTCFAHQEDMQTKTAADIMSEHPIAVDPTTSVETASILLLENKISCLPVVDDENKLIGILSWKDLLRFYVYHT